jgi:hypothetical protein
VNKRIGSVLLEEILYQRLASDVIDHVLLRRSEKVQTFKINQLIRIE